jgi:hypothetical protein
VIPKIRIQKNDDYQIVKPTIEQGLRRSKRKIERPSLTEDIELP